MNPEKNPNEAKTNKSESDLEKQLKGTYESSEIETRIDILKGEIEFLEQMFITIENAEEKGSDIEELKESTSLEIKQSKEKLKKLEELEKNKET